MKSDVVLSGLLPEELAEAADIPLSCARRLFSRIQKGQILPEISPSTIRRVSLDRVKALGVQRELRLVEQAASALDPFIKYAFAGPDDKPFETVRIPLEKAGRYSVCVSSQVGCAIACRFCATGTMGLTRNLEVWEIVAQVQAVSQGLTAPQARVHGVVFQGMGEPLANAARVIAAIRILSEPAGLAIDQRNITVCTSGLIPGIRAVAEALPNVRLGVSIGDAREGKRQAIMPIDETYRLTDVLRAVGEHARGSGYAPMFAYTLLAGVNDSQEAAKALAERAAAFVQEFGIRPRISLIPYNPVAGNDGRELPFERSDSSVLERFRGELLAGGFGSIVRYSGGGDIGAACGQLVQISEKRRTRLAPSASS